MLLCSSTVVVIACRTDLTCQSGPALCVAYSVVRFWCTCWCTCAGLGLLCRLATNRPQESAGSDRRQGSTWGGLFGAASVQGGSPGGLSPSRNLEVRKAIRSAMAFGLPKAASRGDSGADGSQSGAGKRAVTRKLVGNKNRTRAHMAVTQYCQKHKQYMCSRAQGAVSTLTLVGMSAFLFWRAWTDRTFCGS